MIKETGLTDFDFAYATVLKKILDAKEEFNHRTNRKTKSVPGIFFKFSSIPILSLRDIKPLWTCAEAVWFMSGSSNPAFMRHFGFKNWDPFVDKTGNIRAATGFRWRKMHEVDQLMEGLHKLRQDRTNRQAVLMSWEPWEDSKPGPNVPCLVVWHMHIIDGQLHMSILQRSGDMYFGVPHDILGAWIILELCAAAVQAKPGTLSYMISNAHLYSDQWDAAHEMIAREEGCTVKADYPAKLGLTIDDTTRSMNEDKALVIELHQKILEFYHPFPAIHGPSLVK
jgi:thymidylate synthase